MICRDRISDIRRSNRRGTWRLCTCPPSDHIEPILRDSVRDDFIHSADVCLRVPTYAGWRWLHLHIRNVTVYSILVQQRQSRSDKYQQSNEPKGSDKQVG